MRMIFEFYGGIEEIRELMRLHNSIDESLKSFSFKKDYNFHPHITLARVKRIRDRNQFIKRLEKTSLNPITSKINSFILYNSTLTPSGPVHEIVKEFNC